MSRLDGPVECAPVWLATGGSRALFGNLNIFLCATCVVEACLGIQVINNYVREVLSLDGHVRIAAGNLTTVVVKLMA